MVRRKKITSQASRTADKDLDLNVFGMCKRRERNVVCIEHCCRVWQEVRPSR